MSQQIVGFAPPGPRRVRGVIASRMKGYVSKHQGKRTTNTKKKLFEKWLSSLIINAKYRMYSEDLVQSSQNTAGRKYNCAVVKDYGLRMGSVGKYWTLPVDNSHISYVGTVAGLNTIDLTFERVFTYRNTTNFNLYVYRKTCVAKADVPDDRQPSQCWQHDLSLNTSGAYNMTQDVNTEARSVYNLATWDVGNVGGEFDVYWRASAWECVIIPPGKSIVWNSLERIVMTKNEYDTYITDDQVIFKKGMTVMMVKVVAEKSVVTRAAATGEDAVEADALGISYSNIVEFLESVVMTVTVRAYPGFAPKMLSIASEAIASVGAAQFGAIGDANLSNYQRGKVFNEESGLWEVPTVLESMDPLATYETALEQAQGVDEGLIAATFRNSMEAA